MFGQPSFWSDALGNLLDHDEHGICYATYAIDSHQDRDGELWTVFLTDRTIYWCEMDSAGDFTGKHSWARHPEVEAIGPCINDSRGIVYIANHDSGERESFVAQCRDAREAKVVHRLMMTALDLALGQPPFMRFHRERDGGVTTMEPRKPKPPRL